jgi:hypothetical protein
VLHPRQDVILFSDVYLPLGALPLTMQRTLTLIFPCSAILDFTKELMNTSHTRHQFFPITSYLQWGEEFSTADMDVLQK